jgi:hypothetical protein
VNHVLAAARDSRAASCVLVLSTITIFLSAVLLFAVQPMFAKMVLPLLGGTPAVWNTCMVFFQATLLAGYAYAHVTAGAFRVRHQTTIHLALLATPLLLLPIAVPEAWRSPSQDHPVTWLLALLVVALGLPFFVVSTTGPLVQSWFARSDHALAHDPYFLYAASNTGSLVALLAYPTVVEPNLHLADQSRLWSLGYMVLVLLLVGCTAVVWPSRTSTSPQVVPGTRSAGDSRAMLAPAVSISVWKRGRWILLAFIPSSLTLGLTTYVTTDLAPMPLLWVVPLSIYLFSFVLTFGRRIRVSYSLVTRLVPIFVVPLAATMAVGSVGGLWVLVPLHLITLFVASLLCHGELASSRPAADRLTEFYLWISIGGVLGGIFNALVAPAIFNSAVEYPLALAMACLVRRRDTSATPVASRPHDFRLAVVIAAATFGLLWLAHTPSLSSLPAVPAIAVPALLCFAVRNRPLPFGLGMGTLLITGLGIFAAGDETVFRERSFFGVSQVRVYPTERLTLLLSGTTKHGAQSLDPARRQEPLSYYYRTGPIGQVFAALPAQDIPRVAIIGLGAGSLACFGTPGQRFTFYEIDPTVVRIARDPRYFTFLQLCPPEIRVVLGDARLSLAAAPDASYGLIVLDAFSSDAIPSHLMTREALRLYLRKLRESGLLAFHISNNRLDLEPMVANLARDAQLVALAQFDEKVSPDEARAGKTPSHWVVLARRWEDLRALPHSRHWHVLSAGPDKTLWTDDFSNIFEVIKWR